MDSLSLMERDINNVQIEKWIKLEVEEVKCERLTKKNEKRKDFQGKAHLIEKWTILALNL